MKVSEITLDTVRGYAGISADEDTDLLTALLSAAKATACTYTGLTEAQLDDHEDITIAVLSIVHDRYLFRYSQNQPKLTPTAAFVLGQYAKNLI